MPSHHDRNRLPGQTPGGRSQQQEQPSQALQKFRQLIQTRSFTDDEVLEHAQALGRELASYRPRGEKSDSRTQVRKFYNLIRVANNTEEATAKVKLRLLQAQIAYAVARDTLSKDFKNFFDVALEQILKRGNVKDQLKEFTSFFEAFYAYFYFHSPKN
ncbi:MAG TPA: type III-A CRISPR-associated protein Csm2 [Blastocatellia bacterium]|nr:type III-A CRISPR-associated protein Csm2 [Blastocatellia bacterium]